MNHRSSWNKRSASGRSLSLSLESDEKDEPQILKEARRGWMAGDSSCNFAAQGSVGGSQYFRDLSYSGSLRSDFSFSFHRRNAINEGSFEFGREASSLNSFPSISSSELPKRLAFVGDPLSLPSNVAHLFLHNPGDHFRNLRDRRSSSERVNGSQVYGKSKQVTPARVLAAASRNIAALNAQRRQLYDKQRPLFDDMIMQIRRLHRQLDGIKDNVHRRCAYLFDSFVESNWTISTTDSLAQRMITPALLPSRNQAQGSAEETFSDGREWCGPTAIDVFGDNLVHEIKKPYKIVGIFARRYLDTRQRLPYLKHLVCPTILPCLQYAQPRPVRRKAVQQPTEAPAPVKSVRHESSTQLSPQQTSSPEDANRSQTDGANLDWSTEGPNQQEVSDAPRVVSPPLLLPFRASWAGANHGLQDLEYPFCSPQLPWPFSSFACDAIPLREFTGSCAPVGYPKAPIETKNMRIPYILSEYLESNSLPVKRPAWDTSDQEEPLNVGIIKSKSSFLAAQKEETESNCDDEKDEQQEPPQRLFGAHLHNWDIDSIRQLLRKEIGNRWLPGIFTEADVRISDYWKLENMNDGDKAQWVYLGHQTEPKPYPWEEVPMEGKRPTREEFTQQRKKAESEKSLTREAMLLLSRVAPAV